MSRSLFMPVLAALCLTALMASQARSEGYPAEGYYQFRQPVGYPGCYPQLRSSLYPSPRPNVPREVGWTVYTTPAFAPHEMLYPHCYRAMYPPFYYKNTSGLACIPFFPKPCLKGTVVTVKYSSCHPRSFHPPACATKKCFSNTQFR